jgi:hypothetical protein
MREELDRAVERSQLGLVDEMEVQAREMAVAEAELSLTALQNELDVRQDFIDSKISAVEAEILVLKAESERKAQLLQQQMDLVLVDMDRIQERIDAGIIDPVHQAQAELHLAELQAEMELAQIELQVLQRELEARGGQR